MPKGIACIDETGSEYEQVPQNKQITKESNFDIYPFFYYSCRNRSLHF